MLYSIYADNASGDFNDIENVFGDNGQFAYKELSNHIQIFFEHIACMDVQYNGFVWGSSYNDNDYPNLSNIIGQKDWVTLNNFWINPPIQLPKYVGMALLFRLNNANYNQLPAFWFRWSPATHLVVPLSAVFQSIQIEMEYDVDSERIKIYRARANWNVEN